jgi:phosphate acyltransferase
MRIGLDVMGGDFAPGAIVKGAILAAKEMPETSKLVLFGDSKQINDICNQEAFDSSVFEIIHTDEVIEMGDNPVKAFTQKTNSSITVGFMMLAKGKIDGFASAGNTGAMLVGAVSAIKTIPGVIRPVITAVLPQPEGAPKILLDVGINPDCKPDVLYQYGILGSIYAQYMFGINNPKVALLNIGEEEEKGNLVAKSTFQLMKETKEFNFIGNIEANHIFDIDRGDVIVCDGFVGNVMLKEAEAFYKLIRKRKVQDDFFERFNFTNYGGTPVLGVNKPTIIGHGISNDIAIKNMVLQTQKVIEVQLIEKFVQAFNT